MYVVIACPRCKLARTARADQRTAGCPRCGRRIPLKGAHVYLSTEDMGAAARALASVNESLADDALADGTGWGGLRADGRGVPSDGGTPSRRDVLSIARSLSREAAPFTAEDLAERSAMTVERTASLLERWRSEGIAYSPSHGTYVMVDP